MQLINSLVPPPIFEDGDRSGAAGFEVFSAPSHRVMAQALQIFIRYRSTNQEAAS
jgi:hypothetical protein